jgi:alkaline phosphatase
MKIMSANNSVKYLLLIAAMQLTVIKLSGQETYKEDKSLVQNKVIYQNEKVHKVSKYSSKDRKKRPKNIVLLIGDGMGVAHIQAALTANKGELFLNNFKKLGFIKTNCANAYVTDSGAAGTAMACGVKTNKRSIGIDPEGNPIENIREFAKARGKATGLVVTSAVTHATPASFVAHQSHRKMYEEIALDFLSSDIDLFIGGGKKHFDDRKDDQILTEQLSAKGYQLCFSTDELKKVKDGKVAGLLANEHMPKKKERQDFLPLATQKAIEILQKDKDGFFLMIEGSQIDWGSHQNNLPYIVTEMLDFDQTVGAVLEFAARDKNTLVIVTADHETGGVIIKNGNCQKQNVKVGFGSKGHTGVMVPVFAFGPSSGQFTGIMDNTDIAKKIFNLLGK